MTTLRNDPVLLTPGPLTTSATVKEAMLHDWGSRDREFIEMNARVRARLVELAGGGETHVCVPLQGSGTFVVEATLGTLVPRDGKVLLLINGAYGERMQRMLEYHGRDFAALRWNEDQPVDPKAVSEALDADASLGHVAMVHCETTSGILNPVEAVAAVVKAAGRVFIVDAMSAFGAIEVDVGRTGIDAVMASSNKCLEGVPGMGFAVIRRSVLEACKGNAPALCLDLHHQWQAMEANGQWRFTPPTHCIAAFDRALVEHEHEGGVAGRGARYRDNCAILVEGMRAMGFETLLPDALQAPIIVTLRMPADPHFDFQRFYDELGARGYVIYPGKLTVADSFRVGCIGRIGAGEIRGALGAMKEVLAGMQVASGAPER